MQRVITKRDNSKSRHVVQRLGVFGRILKIAYFEPLGSGGGGGTTTGKPWEDGARGSEWEPFDLV